MERGLTGLPSRLTSHVSRQWSPLAIQMRCILVNDIHNTSMQSVKASNGEVPQQLVHRRRGSLPSNS